MPFLMPNQQHQSTERKKKLYRAVESVEVLVWLSVWSEVQIVCILSS